MTKNVLAILVEEQRTIDWYNQYLVLPTPKSMRTEPGDEIDIRFTYRAGGSIESLGSAMEISVQETFP